MGSQIEVQIRVPGSKSLTLRHLVAGSLACGATRLRGALDCDDARALGCSLSALGAGIEWRGEDAEIEGTGGRLASGPVALEAGASGFVLRCLVALVTHGRGRYGIFRRGRLPDRPLLELLAVLPATVHEGPERSLEVEATGDARPALRLGRLRSSQTLSALLLAGPLDPGGVSIELDGPVPSAGYVDLTVSAMAAHGVEVTRGRFTACEGGAGQRLAVPGGSRYRGTEIAIEGDWSSAAALLVGAAVRGLPLRLVGLQVDSKQPDRRIVEILAGSGLELSWTAGALCIRGRANRALDVDLDDAPDLAPPLVALAATLPGRSRFRGLGRLADKESDRRGALLRGLRVLGVEAEAEGDQLTVTGGRLRTGRVDAAADHRIVMAMALLALVEPGIEVSDHQAVAKSYPGFFTDLARLSGPA